MRLHGHPDLSRSLPRIARKNRNGFGLRQAVRQGRVNAASPLGYPTPGRSASGVQARALTCVLG
jgi:hypothetical protein